MENILGDLENTKFDSGTHVFAGILPFVERHGVDKHLFCPTYPLAVDFTGFQTEEFNDSSIIILRYLMA
jgi:hypothetical protein